VERKENMYYRISKREMTEKDCHSNYTSSLWYNSNKEDDRRGISCCNTLEQLMKYFLGDVGTSFCRGAQIGGSYLVELEGEESEDEPWEGDIEFLIHPTKIISCNPVEQTEWFQELLNRAQDMANDKWSSWEFTEYRARFNGTYILLEGLNQQGEWKETI